MTRGFGRCNPPINEIISTDGTIDVTRPEGTGTVDLSVIGGGGGGGISDTSKTTPQSRVKGAWVDSPVGAVDTEARKMATDADNRAKDARMIADEATADADAAYRRAAEAMDNAEKAQKTADSKTSSTVDGTKADLAVLSADGKLASINGLTVPSGGGGGIPDAPTDGKQYVRKSANWSELPAHFPVVHDSTVFGTGLEDAPLGVFDFKPDDYVDVNIGELEVGNKVNAFTFDASQTGADTAMIRGENPEGTVVLTGSGASNFYASFSGVDVQLYSDGVWQAAQSGKWGEWDPKERTLMLATDYTLNYVNHPTGIKGTANTLETGNGHGLMTQGIMDGFKGLFTDITNFISLILQSIYDVVKRKSEVSRNGVHNDVVNFISDEATATFVSATFSDGKTIKFPSGAPSKDFDALVSLSGSSVVSAVIRDPESRYSVYQIQQNGTIQNLLEYTTDTFGFKTYEIDAKYWSANQFVVIGAVGQTVGQPFAGEVYKILEPEPLMDGVLEFVQEQSGQFSASLDGDTHQHWLLVGLKPHSDNTHWEIVSKAVGTFYTDDGNGFTEYHLPWKDGVHFGAIVHNDPVYIDIGAVIGTNQVDKFLKVESAQNIDTPVFSVMYGETEVRIFTPDESYSAYKMQDNNEIIHHEYSAQSAHQGYAIIVPNSIFAENGYSKIFLAVAGQGGGSQITNVVGEIQRDIFRERIGKHFQLTNLEGEQLAGYCREVDRVYNWLVTSDVAGVPADVTNGELWGTVKKDVHGVLWLTAEHHVYNVTDSTWGVGKTYFGRAISSTTDTPLWREVGGSGESLLISKMYIVDGEPDTVKIFLNRAPLHAITFQAYLSTGGAQVEILGSTAQGDTEYTLKLAQSAEGVGVYVEE